jgi:hypothetical protein
MTNLRSDLIAKRGYISSAISILTGSASSVTQFLDDLVIRRDTTQAKSLQKTHPHYQLESSQCQER